MSNHITDEQVKNVFENESEKQAAAEILRDKDKAEEFVRKINKKLKKIPVVGDMFTDVPVLCLMIRDYVQGNYTEIPFGSMIAIVVALIYFLSPIDFVPDAIPVLGQLDDLAVINFAIKMARSDIEDYREWKGI